MNKEIWKDIPEYEGLYQVSNFGEIKSLPRNGTIKEEKILKQHEDKYGYNYVCLHKNDIPKKYKVHRLVAMSFLKKEKNKNIINHKNHNRKDNNADNLEWCDTTYNNQYSLGYKIFKKDTKGNIIETYQSLREFSKKEKICRKTIKKVLNTGKIYKNYLWYS